MQIKLLGAALLMAVGPAFAAGPEQGRFSMSVFGGVDRPVSGDVHTGAVAPVPDLGPLNPALAGVSAELRIRSGSHEQIYGTANSWGLELGYGLSDRSEVFLQARETSADDGRARVGAAYVPALDTELDVFGRFSGYDAYAWEAGYRHFFRDGSRVRPFVAARLGATETDVIRAIFEIPDAAITIPNAPFYEKDWALSGGLEAGAQISFTERFSMKLTAGVNYIDDLSDDDSAIAGLGLAAINDTGSRISVPISIMGRWDF
ncbi:MipA/OmpV family protein [Pseudoxanthomonas sp. PXM01]|uniref:MipA/OmpV family protein n=1 Tax=Pseudoxanthomonas sp. PXM01 TaxID=2769295 RepID=UPI001785E7A2|nr:MipA/OmpV family protein [Pseudoxanthomonas sp. PXM01]MBD9470359.1 MipA/OmpV family protein [Pseudoxanthomonas sp. PXM01]